MNVKFEPMWIPDVILIKPEIFKDERGFFEETYHIEKFREAGITTFVQDNHSRSKKGVLRGLHYQIQQPQGKLVRVTQGTILDIAVDLRQTSSTFGKWVHVILDGNDFHQLYIPPGFAHGFYTLSDSADIMYKCTTLYLPEAERILLWNDLGIDWQTTEPLLSDKDRHGSKLADAELFP